GGAQAAVRTSLGMRWEQITFPASPTLPASLAGPWAAANGHTIGPASMRVLRHDEPRPWVIVVHGAQQGNNLDLRLLRVRHLHHARGFNVALPVLPLHGPRRRP